jgi:predicted component of type VI protein secretion system
MLEEQQTTIGVLASMQDAAKAQKKTMQVGGGLQEAR